MSSNIINVAAPHLTKEDCISIGYVCDIPAGELEQILNKEGVSPSYPFLEYLVNSKFKEIIPDLIRVVGNVALASKVGNLRYDFRNASFKSDDPSLNRISLLARRINFCDNVFAEHSFVSVSKDELKSAAKKHKYVPAGISKLECANEKGQESFLRTIYATERDKFKVLFPELVNKPQDKVSASEKIATTQSQNSYQPANSFGSTQPEVKPNYQTTSSQFSSSSERYVPASPYSYQPTNDVGSTQPVVKQQTTPSPKTVAHTQPATKSAQDNSLENRNIMPGIRQKLSEAQNSENPGLKLIKIIEENFAQFEQIKLLCNYDNFSERHYMATDGSEVATMMLALKGRYGDKEVFKRIVDAFEVACPLSTPRPKDPSTLKEDQMLLYTIVFELDLEENIKNLIFAHLNDNKCRNLFVALDNNCTQDRLKKIQDFLNMKPGPKSRFPGFVGLHRYLNGQIGEEAIMNAICTALERTKGF